MADILLSVLRDTLGLLCPTCLMKPTRLLFPLCTYTQTSFETSGKSLGISGCSHNIFSFLAYFCGSKSGSMFVDAEGGKE